MKIEMNTLIKQLLVFGLALIWTFYLLFSFKRNMLLFKRYPINLAKLSNFHFDESVYNETIFRTQKNRQLKGNSQYDQNEIHEKSMNLLPNDSTWASPESYKRSIHPLHIDLEHLVRLHIENKTEFPVSPINLHPYKYMYPPPVCQFRTEENFTLVVLVKSYVKHTVQRYAIRNTWAKNLNSNVKVVFLLAVAKGFQKYLDIEQKLFHDIVQEDFIDNYRNNTIKLIMGFNWVTTKCRTADVVLFVDDDHLVQMRNLLFYLRSLSREQLRQLYSGILIKNGEVENRLNVKWGVSKTDFSLPTWPPYLRGGAFVISQKIAKTFSAAFPYVKYLSIDDAYLGIVGNKLRINASHDERFQQNREKLFNNKQISFSFNDYKTHRELINAWESVSESDRFKYKGRRPTDVITVRRD